MPGRPCTPEAGAANDLASAHVAGHGHRFRLGMDQPDYLRLLRCFGSCARAALHASVARRAEHYGLHRQMVSIQPQPKAAEADSSPCRELPGMGPSARFGLGASPRIPWQALRRCPRRCADPRVELVFRRLHSWTLDRRPPASQPAGRRPLFNSVQGRSITSSSQMGPSPTGRKNTPVAPSAGCRSRRRPGLVSPSPRRPLGTPFSSPTA